MDEMHPLVVHFPIALALMAVGFDLAALLFKKEQWHLVAKWNFLAAWVFGIISVLTGLYAEDEIPARLSDLVELHKYLSFGFLTLLSILTFWRFKAGGAFPVKGRAIYIIGILSVAGLVGATGHWGGTMVFEHGIGTQIRFQPPKTNESSNNPSRAKYKDLITQGKCIVMPDEDIDTNIFVTHKEEKIFLCCNKCKSKFLKNPDIYLK